jgi:hypothetical protein
MMLPLGVAGATLGLALLIVSGLADVIGVGAEEEKFGWKQIVGLIVGFAAIDIGAVVAWIGARGKGS